MGGWEVVFLPAVFGSAIQELAYWWQLRFKLSGKKYQEQMRSVAYWIVVLAMVIGSGIGTVIWFWSENTNPKNAMVFGAAFPLIFKHAVDVVASKSAKLGGHRPPVPPPDATPNEGWTLGSYFTMR